MKKAGPAVAWSARLNGLITEAMDLTGLSKAELSERVGLGVETLKRKGTGKTLGSLEFLTVAMIAEAAGYEIEFRRKAS